MTTAANSTEATSKLICDEAQLGKRKLRSRHRKSCGIVEEPRDHTATSLLLTRIILLWISQRQSIKQFVMRKLRNKNVPPRPRITRRHARRRSTHSSHLVKSMFLETTRRGDITKVPAKRHVARSRFALEERAKQPATPYRIAVVRNDKSVLFVAIDGSNCARS